MIRNLISLSLFLPRFCWWSAEEVGLLGSTHYVSQLSPTEKSHILANINIDMIGSPNFFYGVYNGSSANETIRPQCEYIQNLFITYLNSINQKWTFTAFDGRSDYGNAGQMRSITTWRSEIFFFCDFLLFYFYGFQLERS